MKKKPTKNKYLERMSKQYSKAKALAQDCFKSYICEKNLNESFTHSMKNNICRTLVNLSYAGIYKILLNDYNEERIPDIRYFNQLLETENMFSTSRKYFKKISKEFNCFEERKVLNLLSQV